ncbi:AMP-dependent synthetase [Photorhabdus luminescens subsp. luminescens]|uniref:Yersiniabactin salicyl-AMP ligase n=2 Tax=Photorhabdus luminescens TaxID=29488 RepID=A0A1G5PR81_PHOLU|nr:salicylate synthase [Photorhabdus luminescens]KMW74623.1 AMP-dependent synthetase [Photorhabdus luminescens subsp. luminescens]SCZ51549.1 yersiniabactin salicyl-AMP ligase [Photorhabdus luminescens]
MAPFSIPGKTLTMTPDYLWNGKTLDQQLAGWSGIWGDKTALIYQEQQLTYRELHQSAERLASGLFRRGVRRGDNVMVQLPNRISFVVTCFALFRLGAHPVLLMPTQRTHDVHALCQIARPVAYIIPDCIHDFDYREMAREIAASCPDLKHIIVDGEAEEFTALASIDDEPANIPGPSYGDIAVLLLSGGTTGTPKLIPRTHDAYTYDFVLSARLCAVNTESVYLAVLPVAHNFTLGSPGILGTLSQGGSVLMSDTASCDEAMPLIEQYKVTHLALVPALARLWEQARDWEQSDLSSLRCLQVGGGRLTPELAEQVIARLGPLQQVFGTAEGLLCYTRLDDPHEVIINTQGRPLSEEDEIKIVDANLQPVAPSEVGELITRGPYTITGYYRAEQHNTVAFTTDGFYRTGDLVRMTSDGNLIVEGRIKEQINRSGEKISTQEVETLLLQHPDIDDAVVISVPDELLGERTCACLPNNGNQPEPGQIEEFLQQKGVQRHKIPDQWLFVPYWPLTTVGKIDKRRLVQMAQAEHGCPMQQYHEQTVSIASTPLDLITHLLSDDNAQPYMLYEVKGEWSLGIGCAATICADASGQLLDAQGNCHPYDISTLSQKLEQALNALPIQDWRAYGRTLFEFSHMTYGLPLAQQNEALIKITIPQHELRITQGQVLIRTLEEGQLAILSGKISQADQLGTPVFSCTEDMEIINKPDAAKYYQDNVANAVKDIAAGHYQKVILSRRVELGSDIDMPHSYWLGRQANTPARSFFLRDEDFSVYGFSPETVVEADGSGWVSTQPLAGTRALTHDKDQDQRLRADLLSDPKEISEHAVSAKLALEELAPICQSETLCVSEFMAIRERGSVQHLASRVKGLLQTDKNCWDAFIALFPAVTASGIPKKPSLQAISRYEGEPRRLYSGCVMLLDSSGKLDAALVLRSLYQYQGRCWLQAGAGLVRDSKPEREWQETCEKLDCIMKYVRPYSGKKE